MHNAVIDGPGAEASAQSSGVYGLECYGPDGELRWKETLKNGVCLAALDDMLNKYLRAGTPPAAWYLGLIDNAGFTQLAAADTAASHAGWAENTSYSGGVRPTWVTIASSGQAVTNSTQASFPITATITVKGIFCISDSTLGGTAGMLFSTAALSGGNQVCNNGDTLKATYTNSLTAS